MNIILFCLNDWLSLLAESIGTILPPDVRGALVGAIVGALGAYWVSQKTLRKERIGKRWFEHRNSLVKIEPFINEMIDINSGNRMNSEKIISINTTEDGIPIARSHPNQFPTNLNYSFPFLRLDLINKLFSYNAFIRKVNKDIYNINIAYDEMWQAKLNNNIDKSQYLKSLIEYQDANRTLIVAYSLIDKRSIELLAHVRVALDKDSQFDNNPFNKMPKLEEINESDIEVKIELMIDEIEEVSKKSRDELDEHGITKRRNC